MSARQTWRMLCPPEPGPEVTCVRDRDGDLWDRVGNTMWRLEKTLDFQRSWLDVVRRHGPLQDASTPDSAASAATRPTPANVPPAQPRGAWDARDARDAGDAAAWSARAWAALKPTIEQLQDSAIDLYTRMITPNG